MGLFDKLLNRPKKAEGNNVRPTKPVTKPTSSNSPSQPSQPGASSFITASSIVDNEEEFERQIAEIIKLETESFKLPTFVAESFYQLDGSESGVYEVIVQLIQTAEDSSQIQLAKEIIAGGSSTAYETVITCSPLICYCFQIFFLVNQTEQGVTLLHIAVIHNRNDFADFLLDKGAQINARVCST